MRLRKIKSLILIKETQVNSTLGRGIVGVKTPLIATSHLLSRQEQFVQFSHFPLES